LYLAWVPDDRQYTKKGEREFRQIYRLLTLLPKKAMGKNAYNKLKQWGSRFHTIWESTQAVSQPKPARVFLAKSVAEVLEDRHWIIIPRQCRGKDTLPAHTINLSSFFPPPDNQNLPYFADMLGFSNVEDRDQEGRNILHILFTAMKYCCCVGQIAKHAFDFGADRLEGDYGEALRQPIQHGAISGYTPLHILCKNSDASLTSLDVVKALIEMRILKPSEFSDQRNHDVSVFSFWNTVCHESALGQLESWGDVSKRRQGC